MTIPLKNLKAPGVSNMSSKLAKMPASLKSTSLSVKAPKVPKMTTPKSLNLSKFTKTAKLPKQTKISIIKIAIKKKKNA